MVANISIAICGCLIFTIWAICDAEEALCLKQQAEWIFLNLCNTTFWDISWFRPSFSICRHILITKRFKVILIGVSIGFKILYSLVIGQCWHYPSASSWSSSLQQAWTQFVLFMFTLVWKSLLHSPQTRVPVLPLVLAARSTEPAHGVDTR